jgi:hypothetical protein
LSCCRCWCCCRSTCPRSPPLLWYGWDIYNLSLLIFLRSQAGYLPSQLMGRSIIRLIVWAEETTKSQSKPYKKKLQKPKIKNHTPHHNWIANQKKHQTLEINNSWNKPQPRTRIPPPPPQHHWGKRKAHPGNKQTDIPKINGLARQK